MQFIEAAPDKLDTDGPANVEGRSHQESEPRFRRKTQQESQEEQREDEYKCDARNDPSEIEDAEIVIAQQLAYRLNQPLMK